jgi:hypothetical protein
VYAGESIYFWNSAAKRVEYLYIANQGGFSLGTMATDDRALVFPATSLVADGKSQTYRSRWERAGDDAYEVVTEYQVKDGWSPGFRMRMVRVGPVAPQGRAL